MTENNTTNIVEEVSAMSDQDQGEKDHLPEVVVEPNPEEGLKNELKDTHERLLRVAAEFENFKKISQREHLNTLKFANEGLILLLLPLLDNLEQAIKSGKNNDAAKDLVLGVEMVLKLFYEALEKVGVQFFDAYGEAFDPSRHEAIGEREDEIAAAGTVIEQFTKGSLIHGRLLRAARVIVAKNTGK